jgi:GTPase involved in cell partitioning and DNA repair
MINDRIHILVQSGDGGNGCESYYRRNDKKVLPNGGDGGNGGRIIFRRSSPSGSSST